jgi:hypothetical protein
MRSVVTRQLSPFNKLIAITAILAAAAGLYLSGSRSTLLIMCFCSWSPPFGRR